VPAAPALLIGQTEFYILAGNQLGDVSRQTADVLVSSTGTDAWMRVGVSNAIRQRGGDDIEAQLRALLPFVPGDVVMTTAGTLPAKYIYHGIVVNWSDSRPVLQASVWRVVARCMTLAQNEGLTSIALPQLTPERARYGRHSFG